MKPAHKDRDTKADVAALFNDPEQKAELETFLKEKADIAELPDDKDVMDTPFF